MSDGKAADEEQEENSSIEREFKFSKSEFPFRATSSKLSRRAKKSSHLFESIFARSLAGGWLLCALETGGRESERDNSSLPAACTIRRSNSSEII